MEIVRIKESRQSKGKAKILNKDSIIYQYVKLGWSVNTISTAHQSSYDRIERVIIDAGIPLRRTLKRVLPCQN